MANVQGFDALKNACVKAAVSNALTQGISLATGAQEHFSWRGVTGAAAGAYASSWMSETLLGDVDATGQHQPNASSTWFEGVMADAGEREAAARFLTGLASSASSAVMQRGHISRTKIFTDAFGNVLGEAITAQMRPDGLVLDANGWPTNVDLSVLPHGVAEGAGPHRDFALGPYARFQDDEPGVDGTDLLPSDAEEAGAPGMVPVGGKSHTYRASDRGPWGTALRVTGGDRDAALRLLGAWEQGGAFTHDANGNPALQDGQDLPGLDPAQLSPALGQRAARALGVESRARADRAEQEAQAALKESRDRAAEANVGAALSCARGADEAPLPQAQTTWVAGVKLTLPASYGLEVGSPAWRRVATVEELRGNGDQVMSAWDPAADRAAEELRRYQQNSIGLAAAGVFALPGLAARGMNAPESVVEAVTYFSTDVGMT